MRFPATPDSVGTARRFVADRLRGWPGEVVADALLLVSELCTNCVLHARTDYVVRVVVDDGTVRVEVLDEEPALPGARRGPGLRLVDELADTWGAEPDTVGGPGKVVWFELSSSGG